MGCQGENWNGESISSSTIPQLYCPLGFQNGRNGPKLDCKHSSVTHSHTSRTACPLERHDEIFPCQNTDFYFFLRQTDNAHKMKWQMLNTDGWQSTQGQHLSTWPRLVWRKALATVSPCTVSSYALTLDADLAFENGKVGKTQSPGARQGHVAYIYTMGYSQLKSQAWVPRPSVFCPHC